MKPAQLAERLSPALDKFCCPRCKAPFHLTQQSLVCENGHCFDLSRRGYVNLAPMHDQASEKYDATLFDSRRLIFEHGFYRPVADAIAALLPAQEPFFLLDAGCGEGYYARLLSQRFPQSTFLGVDISRDAITAAAREASPVHWMVADLKHLPLADDSADVLLDVLTPADYEEFFRVLKPDGLLIKVIPGADYLREVRSAVSPWLKNGAQYDNTPVLEHLRTHADILSEKEVRVTKPLTPAFSRAFLRMTPMTFSVPEAVLDTLQLSETTIHMHVVACRMKK